MFGGGGIAMKQMHCIGNQSNTGSMSKVSDQNVQKIQQTCDTAGYSPNKGDIAKDYGQNAKKKESKKSKTANPSVHCNIQTKQKPGAKTDNSEYQEKLENTGIQQHDENIKKSIEDMEGKYKHKKFQLEWYKKCIDVLAPGDSDPTCQQIPSIPLEGNYKEEMQEAESGFETVQRRFRDHESLWQAIDGFYRKFIGKDLEKTQEQTKFYDYHHHQTKIAFLQLSVLESWYRQQLHSDSERISFPNDSMTRSRKGHQPPVRLISSKDNDTRNNKDGRRGEMRSKEPVRNTSDRAPAKVRGQDTLTREIKSTNEKYIRVKLQLEWCKECVNVIASKHDFSCPQTLPRPDDNVAKDVTNIQSTLEAVLNRFFEHETLWKAVNQLYLQIVVEDESLTKDIEKYEYFHGQTIVALLQISTLETHFREIQVRTRSCGIQHLPNSNEKSTSTHEDQTQCLSSGHCEHWTQLKEIENVLRAEKTEKQKALEEKELLLTRLSELAGNQFRENNPSVVDLSDENRPIRLAERFGELYDNEWTDAFEKLDSHYPESLESGEKEKIQILLDIFKETYDICHSLKEKQQQVLQDWFGVCPCAHDIPDLTNETTGSQSCDRKEVRRHAITFMKATTQFSLDRVKQIIMKKATFYNTHPSNIANCEQYIDRCIELSWHMNTQEFPVVPVFDAKYGEKFPSNLYREYTRLGDLTDYVVWPALLLHEDGPILYKGVIQPICSKNAECCPRNGGDEK